MQLAVDLHSHSGYAGGVGNVSLDDIAVAMQYKGIDVYGCGDCLFPLRTEELKKCLIETEEGLFTYQNQPARFLLQTEVIFTVSLKGYKNRILAHHLIFFPSFESIAKMQVLMTKWGQKNTIGRPFIACKDQQELEDRLFEIAAIHPLLEIVPAHVMTPEGIMGSRNRLHSIQEFYGRFTPQIRIIETGLSADPDMLCRIPDLANLTMISNSDTHSAALNRIGREFTILETDSLSYPNIISSLRNNRIVMTSEFFPGEGRYYMTGHRANRDGHTQAVIFEDHAPDDLICPVCGKKMFLGVRQRCLELTDNGIIPIKREFRHLLPLLEVIAVAHGKGVQTKLVWEEYQIILQCFESEIDLWRSDVCTIEYKLDKRVKEETLKTIIAVRNEQYHFCPSGYDGVYGVL
ncbi:MAG TPA: endonuclease Q family protein, partial [Candidatus Cloacimonadota bacterium]|nr:endonuclease Q family protein [Candidatus Cloacimonadota bacterium]